MRIISYRFILMQKNVAVYGTEQKTDIISYNPMQDAMLSCRPIRKTTKLTMRQLFQIAMPNCLYLPLPHT